MVPRLYLPALTAGARTALLPRDEADHVRRVLRAKVGSAVRVFDGRGSEREARVAALGRQAVEVELGDAVTPAAECRVRVTLAQAVLKGDKTDAVVRDAVMMGVAAVQPLLTARAEVPAAAFERGARLERWRRVAVASVKQCGRAVVPEIAPPRTLQACVAGCLCEANLILVEPSAAAVEAGIADVPAAPSSALVLVGPEGGWSGDEIEAALASGCVPMTLGPRTLRADAAPIVALSVLLYRWGELSRPVAGK